MFRRQKRINSMDQLTAGFTDSGLSQVDIETYLSGGGDINAKDSSLWALIHYAAEDSDLKLIIFLKSKGADLNITNDFGRTPLHLAANADTDTALTGGKRPQSLPTVELLISLGADTEKMDFEGLKAKDIVCQNGCGALWKENLGSGDSRESR